MKLMLIKLMIAVFATIAAHQAVRQAKTLLREAQKWLYKDPGKSLTLLATVDDQVSDSILVRAGLADLRSAILATARANCYQ